MRSPDAYSANTKAAVRGKAHELGVLQQLTAAGTLVIDDHRLHLVEEQFGGHATEACERFLQAAHEHCHRLPLVELQPEQSPVGQHDNQRIALAPRQPELSEVHLPLMARRVSKRTIGSTTGAGRPSRTYSLTWV
jgi:hypothetical protein